MSIQKQSRGLKTKINLLNAAKQLFHDKGFAKTSAKEICELANVKPSNFNYYFESKEKLLQEIYSEIFMKSYSFVESNITYKVNSIEKNVLSTYTYVMGVFKDEQTTAFHYETLLRESPAIFLGNNFRHVYKQFHKDLNRKVTSLELANLINADIGMRRELYIYFIEHPGEQELTDLINFLHIFRGRLLQMDESVMKSYLFNAYEFERNYDHSHICLLV